VVVRDIRDDLGEMLAEELGERAHHVRLDVTREVDRAAAVEATESRVGPLSVLVNNAGILSPSRRALPASWGAAAPS
jgi:3alpha(or 20beta)-hydroxysteroid dehydrogenase